MTLAEWFGLDIEALVDHLEWKKEREAESQKYENEN